MTNPIEAIASAIKQAITDYKETIGVNESAFSVDIIFEDGEFKARVAFCEDSTMTIMYRADTDNEVVKSLFNETNDKEILRLAGIIWENDFLAF